MPPIVVIGGGIAGIAAAWALSKRGRDVVVLEREPLPGTQSTGRSAAIFRLAVTEAVNVRLALRSREIGRELVPGGTVRALGGVYPCEDDAQRRRILDAAAVANVRESKAIDVPEPLAHRSRAGVFSPDDGVIDVHALVEGLTRAARSGGAQLRFGVTFESLVFSAGRVSGVVANGEELAAEAVVDATGAWSPTFAGVAHPAVRPHRRHLFVLDSPVSKAFRGVVWDLTDDLYLRPESGGLLVSPCDEEAMAGTRDVPTSTNAGAMLFDKLTRWAPSLAGASVRRVWAGLRPLTADHRFVVGWDRSISGLFRLGGFGGHGITGGAAAGEVAAALLCGDDHPDAAELAPGRD